MLKLEVINSLELSENIVKRIKKRNSDTLNLFEYFKIFVPLKAGLEFLEEFKKLSQISIDIHKDRFLFNIKIKKDIQNIHELYYRFYNLVIIIRIFKSKSI